MGVTMTLADFKKLMWQRQNAIIEPVLRDVLTYLAEPVETKEIVKPLLLELGWDHNGAAGYLIGRILIRRFAKQHPEWATHDGEHFKKLGRDMQRWRWHPLRYTGPGPEITGCKVFPDKKQMLVQLRWPDGETAANVQYAPRWKEGPDDQPRVQACWDWLAGEYEKRLAEAELFS